MKIHKAHCVSAGCARRIIRLSKCAIGYPLPDGTWSCSEGMPFPFLNGEKIELHLMSKKEGKIYLITPAIIIDDRRDDEGCFLAVFPAAFKD